MQRHTRLRSRRKSAAERARIEAVRREVYDRDRGICQLRYPGCTGGNRRLPFEGDVFTRAHTCHIVSAGRRGPFIPENLRLGCFHCHIECEHNAGGKPCPPKERATEELSAGGASRV